MTIGVKLPLAEVLASFLRTLYTKEHEEFAREEMAAAQSVSVSRRAGKL